MRLYDDQLIVITGAAGFIGSCLVKMLNDLGMENLLLVDRLGSDEKWKNLVGKKFMDLLDPSALFSWLEGRPDRVEAFVHLGAITDTLETDSDLLLEQNYNYSKRLVEEALKHGHRFLYASSAATYGDGASGFSDQETSVFSLHPLNPYGFSKQLFDQWAFQQGILDRIVGIKYFNVYGPNEWHKGRMASPIPRMVRQVQEKGYIELFASNDPGRYPDGEQKRDFIYVKDAVRITAALLKSDATGIFNVGSGEAISWNRLARAVFHALGRGEDIRYTPMPDALSRQYQNYSCAAMEHACEVLGKQSIRCCSIEEGVQDYVTKHLLVDQRW